MSRVAVIGCGYWGRNHVRNFAELGALAVVVDADLAAAAREAEKYGVTAETLDQALSNPAIEGVVIAAPAELHAELGIRALNAGKHVFVEKPLALTVQDGLRMKSVAQSANRTLMVGHLLQYHPAFEALLAATRAGELGALRYAYSHRLSLGKLRTEENVLWSFAPHDLSMLLALFDDEPSDVAWSGGAFVTEGVEDEAHLDMRFNDGRRAHVFASWLHPFKEHRLVVVGEKAMAVFEDSNAGPEKLRLYRHRIEAGAGAPQPVKADEEYLPYDNHEPLKRQCEHFLDCVAGRATPRTDADEALRVLRVLASTDNASSQFKVA